MEPRQEENKERKERSLSTDSLGQPKRAFWWSDNAQRMTKVTSYAADMNSKKLHELIVPVIKGYQKWVNELSQLALSFDEDGDDEAV